MTDARSAAAGASEEQEADRAVARGDLAAGRRLLERATLSDPARLDPWLKLAALCRRDGDLPAALDAVSGALRIEPLGFLPLLLKANLLEQSGRTKDAGEFYGYALAQRPSDIPAHLQAMVSRAEQAHAEHLKRQEARLLRAVDERRLDPAERQRLARFRSNILRVTRPYHSEPTHFHYPGLRESEFHEPGAFPWLHRLKESTAAITEDFQRVVGAERAQLVPYVQYPDDVPLRQWAELNRNPAWTAIHLVRNGLVVEPNARHCSSTMALLDWVDSPRITRRGPNLMFSMLAPGAHIPPHNGVSNTRLVCHLPLIVPPGCWFRVGADRREWRVGEPWVFDDTIEHEAANPTDKLRVILIFDVWHPGLSLAERESVSATMAAVDPDEEVTM